MENVLSKVLTEKGYERRTYEDILNAKIARARHDKFGFGADIDTSELTPLGKFLRIEAYDQALIEELAEQIYYSIFPSTAEGTSLDRLSPFFGLTRNQATPARFKVKVIGKEGVTVPLADKFRVCTESSITYYNTKEETLVADSTLGEDTGENSGSCIITVECEEKGEIGNVIPSEINKILTGTNGISKVIGLSVEDLGTETESDYKLRQRMYSARGGLGSCTKDSIIAALMAVTDVTSVSVAVNETDETDAAGRPPRSFQCYVEGGDEYDIAKTIFDKKPIGIKTYAPPLEEGEEMDDSPNKHIVINDAGGHEHTIHFSRTTQIDVYVDMDIHTTAEFPTDGVDKVRKAVSDYINDLGVGKSVILSTLYEVIHSVDGVEEVTYLALSKDGEQWQNTSISINEHQNASCKDVLVETPKGE